MENNNPQAPPPQPPSSSSYPNPLSLPLPQQPPFHQLLQQQQQQLQMFWSYQRQEIEQANDFRNHQLPLARIKKIMKADEDVRMISAEAPILFAKACELFILELTIRSWLHAEENKRRTLQKNDIAAAITRTDIFDFLVDIVPRDEIKEESGLGIPYYGPPGGGVTALGRPALPGMDPSMYVHPPSQAWQSVWQTADDGAYGTGAGIGQANLDGQGSLLMFSIETEFPESMEACSYTEYTQRRQLWMDLTHVYTTQLPWAVIGDFNAIIGAHEKRGGSLPSHIFCEEFTAFLTHVI